jgi:hypothetical protein
VFEIRIRDKVGEIFLPHTKSFPTEVVELGLWISFCDDSYFESNQDIHFYAFCTGSDKMLFHLENLLLLVAPNEALHISYIFGAL